VDVPMTGAFNKRHFRFLQNPWRYSYGVALDDFVIQCGPMTEHPEYSPDSETWSVVCAGLMVLWNRKRILLTDLSYPNLSLHDVARTLIAQDMAQTYGDLPVDLPSQNNLGGASTTYEAAKLPKIGDLLRDLTDEDNGIELEFRPYFVDPTTCDQVRHTMRIGAPFLGSRTKVHRWSRDKSLVSVSPSGGGGRIADTYIVAGQSTGGGSTYGISAPPPVERRLATQGWPLLMDLDSTHTSEADVTTLTSYANANYAAHHDGPRQITARVKALPAQGQGPRLTDWSLGDEGIFPVRGYLGMPDADFRCRILGSDLVNSDEVDLELQVLAEVNT